MSIYLDALEEAKQSLIEEFTQEYSDVLIPQILGEMLELFAGRLESIPMEVEDSLRIAV